jgi:excisionase family DNA binding protein
VAEFLTAAEVASALGISKTTAYKVMREIGCVHVGRVVRVSREAFDAWVASHTEKPKAKKREPRADDQLALFKPRTSSG